MIDPGGDTLYVRYKIYDYPNGAYYYQSPKAGTPRRWFQREDDADLDPFLPNSDPPPTIATTPYLAPYTHTSIFQINTNPPLPSEIQHLYVQNQLRFIMDWSPYLYYQSTSQWHFRQLDRINLCVKSQSCGPDVIPPNGSLTSSDEQDVTSPEGPEE